MKLIKKQIIRSKIFMWYVREENQAKQFLKYIISGILGHA